MKTIGVGVIGTAFMGKAILLLMQLQEVFLEMP